MHTAQSHRAAYFERCSKFHCIYLQCPLTPNLTYDQITCNFRKLIKIEVCVLASLYFNLRCSITDRCQMKWFFISVCVEFPSELKQETFIHGEISIRPKLGFRFHQRQNSQSWLLLGNQKVDPCNTLPKT